ncbi:hypothetical protein Y032_0009g763 [Ancylostoma ceylanicum]|nr:hypothetical protein Y032_0009g763 [Ancylostoma ceylanicum]
MTLPLLLCLSIASLAQLSISLQCIHSIPGENEVSTISCDGLCMRQIVLMDPDAVDDASSTKLIAISRDCSLTALTEELAANCSDTETNALKRPEPRVIICFCSTDYCNF